MAISLTIKKPSAIIPLAMSASALTVVLVHIIVMFGVARQVDEGAAAHVWQLLMAGQVPVVAFFALKWLPRSPKDALLVLAFQVAAALAACAPVFFLGL